MSVAAGRLEAAIAAANGLTFDEALAAITIDAARVLGVDARVGSLEVGKDADIVISTGSILDPRHYVVLTLIDGAVAYDIKKDKRRF